MDEIFPDKGKAASWSVSSTERRRWTWISFNFVRDALIGSQPSIVDGQFADLDSFDDCPPIRRKQ